MSKIVFLGDSVTASANVAPAQRWVQMVGLSAGNARIHAIATCGIHAGSFLPDQANVPEECPPDATELTLALSELQAKGVSQERLQRVMKAL